MVSPTDSSLSICNAILNLDASDEFNKELDECRVHTLLGMYSRYGGLNFDKNLWKSVVQIQGSALCPKLFQCMVNFELQRKTSSKKLNNTHSQCRGNETAKSKI